jgi:hypothetical protein
MQPLAASDILSLDAGVFCDILLFADSVEAARLSIALTCRKKPFVQSVVARKIAAEHRTLLEGFNSQVELIGLNHYRKNTTELVIADFRVLAYKGKLRLFPSLAAQSFLTARWNRKIPWPELWNTLLTSPW